METLTLTWEGLCGSSQTHGANVLIIIETNSYSSVLLSEVLGSVSKDLFLLTQNTVGRLMKMYTVYERLCPCMIYTGLRP